MQQPMNRLLLIIWTILLYSNIFAQGRQTNVKLTVHVSPFINKTEQMLYVYLLNGNNYSIEDSVRIEPGRDVYEVKANVPYETTVNLLFSERGPLHMQVLASPGDSLEIEITEADQHVGITEKCLLKGTPNHSAFVDFWDTILSIGQKQRKAENWLSVYGISADEKSRQQAIVDSCDRAKIEYERHIVADSPSPAVTREALILLEDNISPEEYVGIVKAAYNRFPNYLTIKMAYNNANWPPATEGSKKAKALIRSVERARIMQKPIMLPQKDSIAIGEKLDLTLIDSVGEKRALSLFAGKYVLIELWASWCIPCIQAMPNIIHAQKMFTDDFVCCAITIDKDANSWKRSIEREELQILPHFKATDDSGEILEPFKRLIIKGTIPQNYLLDREGKIIAINIYGEELIKKLEELTKKK